jgi:hypothetical protein
MTMQICEFWFELLAQYVADGEPAVPEYAALRAHLGECGVCRAQLVRLRQVERELRTLPGVDPAQTLFQRIMAQVAQAEQAAAPEEPWFSWSVWVPAITLIVALLCVAMLMPAQALPSVQWAELDRYLLEERAPLTVLLPLVGAQADPTLSLAVWSAVFSIMAGLGLMLSLRSWREEHNRSLNQIEHQVMDAAHWLGNMARRAH